MKRSETVLVYGVTGILAVILGIAVVFGNDPVKTAESVTNASDSLDLAGLLDPAEVDSEAGGAAFLLAAGADAAVDFPAVDLSAVDPLLADPAEETAEPAAEYSLEVPLVIKPEPTVTSLFGTNRVVEVEGDLRYRVVQVAKGDAMSLLVQRWCGSLDAYWDEAVALNEQIDVQRLTIGSEIWLPYRDDQTLIDANSERGLAAAIPALGRPTEGPDAGAVLTKWAGSERAAGSSAYVLQPGESLWVVAVRAVSPRRAKAYIEEILELNPKITDPGRVRSGMKILLPAVAKH